MKYAAVNLGSLPPPPRRATAEQAEYDDAISAMAIQSIAIVITVDAESDPKSIRTRLARAATRAGVKVATWYDVESAQVYCKIKE